MEPKKLLVFGGSGFVGTRLAQRAAAQGWQVIAADRCCPPSLDSASNSTLIWFEVDITRPDQVARLVCDLKPSAVVNAAALADIDRAEREQDLAWRINVDGARNVAEACAADRLRHIFFSSDAVFDGRAGPYKEGDPLAPINHYGRTKAEAEKAVIAAHPASVLLRISLVLGFPVASGNSYLAGLNSKLESGQEVTVSQDEIRTPIDVHTLCSCVLELLQDSYTGALHIGSVDSIDRYSLAVRLALKLGYDAGKIHPDVARAGILDKAPRHLNGILDVSRAREILKTQMPDLNQTIQRAVETKQQAGKRVHEL